MTERFIKKAKNIHGEKYDYSKVVYKNAHSKIILICKEHGEFEQKPHNHLTGYGCIKCVDRTLRKSCKEDFIKKAIQVHGDKYDYSKFIYINCKTKGVIICNEHGEFEQNANNHLQGKKCSKCSGCYKPTTEEFIEKVLKIHGDIYDYSKVKYIDNRTNIIIICRKHGEFEQSAGGHIQGHGCNKCIDRGGTQRYDTNCFINKAIEIHGDEYNYSKVEYINSLTKVIIICNEHGEFEQQPSSHLQGRKCSKCSGFYKPTTQEFIEKSIKIHGDIYDYSKVEYIDCKQKIIIICNKHGEFEQTPDGHIQGHSCTFCINKTEYKLYETLKQSYPSIITQFKQEWCKRKSYLPFDFCIIELKIIIELDGPQHFQQVSNWSSPEEQFENDIYKQNCANENGYSIIRLLQEDVINDNYDWNKELCETIEFIKNNEKSQIIYLCKNDEYKSYK